MCNIAKMGEKATFSEPDGGAIPESYCGPFPPLAISTD